MQLQKPMQQNSNMKYDIHTQEYESNIFEIENLGDLSSSYFLFEIIGLNQGDEDYDINIQFIIKSLSYKLRHPVTVIHKGQVPYLVVRNEENIILNVPSEYTVKRGNVIYFKRTGDSFDINFKNYSGETKSIIWRFLQFDLQTELNKIQNLWQPGSGEAFFNRDTSSGNAIVAIHRGFLVRVMEMPEGGIGICVDVTQKYLSRAPLDSNLTRQDFKKLQVSKSNYVYQYGNKQYEIKPKEFSDLNISQYKFKRRTDGKTVTLLEDVKSQYGPSMPPLVAKLPNNASVLIYTTNDNEERRVPAGLCFKVYDTEDPAVKKLHKEAIIPPFYRRRFIRVIYTKYLTRLKYGSIGLKIKSTPVRIKKRKFQVPDVKFGHDVILSVRNSPGSMQTILGNFGRRRKDILFQKEIGSYTVAPFERQLFVLPETDFNMYGNDKYFLKHLKFVVNSCHNSEGGWNPDVVVYDNINKTTSVEIGLEILDKIAEKVKSHKGGYAIVMLPSDIERNKRKHDELAALVVSQCLSENGITASIMHNGMLEECFFHNTVNGESKYEIKPPLKNKYHSYLKGVALNQVLLNNERWPFILSNPLHADLTIGIDVKRNMAGFTFIDKCSENILTKFDKSPNKEKLSTGQVVRMLTTCIPVQATYANYQLGKIVVHRDGRLFSTEKAGIQKAISILIEKGILPGNVMVTLVEIPKQAIVPFRLFEPIADYDVVNTTDDNGKTYNPEIGSWAKINEMEAFLCTTGREYVHDGTSNPLFVKIDSGAIPMEEILEDIFFLSCLPYTRPEDCSRFPLTIKITDRRINNLGSDFDSETLEILKSENIKI